MTVLECTRESGLEEPACALATKVVKVKVFYFQFSALSPKRSADRPCVVRKYASAMAPCETVLLVNDFPGIISTDVQQRDALIVSIFPARILAIPYKEHLVFAVEIRPLDATDFILAHGRRNREANDAAERNLLPWIRVKCWSIRRSVSRAHPSASLWRRNVLLTYFPFRLTWTRHEPDLSRVKVATACALRVH